MEMRFDAWNVRSMHGANSFMTGTKELAKYESDLVGSIGGQMGQRWHQTFLSIHKSLPLVIAILQPLTFFRPNLNIA
jgi:hypothetical protein